MSIAEPGQGGSFSIVPLDERQPERCASAFAVQLHLAPSEAPAFKAALIYRALFRLILQRTDAEAAHRWAGRVLASLASIPGLRRALARWLGARDSSLRVAALGLEFATPLGVAAGVDKDGTWFPNLLALGFGHVEVGTITSLPQPGNEVPRIFRLPRVRGLVNSMGFPNPGAEVVAPRLERGSALGVVGANVGKTRVLPIEEIGNDYCTTARWLAPRCDYFVVNVSSPNTPGLLEMQDVARSRHLIEAVMAELRSLDAPPPLLIKIGPDLTDPEVDALATLALDLGLDGIVAVNTTRDLEHLDAATRAALGSARGGISGAPLRGRARHVLRRLRAVVGDEMILISVGGVDSPEEAWKRIAAGATLVQAYAGFVYGGPLWAHRMNSGLRGFVRRAGLANIQEAVGIDAPDPGRPPPAPSVEDPVYDRFDAA